MHNQYPHCGHVIPHGTYYHGSVPRSSGMSSDMYERFVNKIARVLVKQEEYAKAGTAIFDGFIDENIICEAVGSTVDNGLILFSVRDKEFVYRVDNKYYDDWRTRPAYMTDDYKLRTDKVYVYKGDMYHYDADKRKLVKYMEMTKEEPTVIKADITDEEFARIVNEVLETIASKEAEEKDEKEEALKEYIKNCVAENVKEIFGNINIKSLIDYSEVSSFNVSYDKEENILDVILKLPVEGIKNYLYTPWMISINPSNNFISKSGDTISYTVLVYRTKTRMINGERTEDVEVETLQTASPSVYISEGVDYATINTEEKTVTIAPNETDEHRIFKIEATWGGFTGSVEIEQCK